MTYKEIMVEMINNITYKLWEEGSKLPSEAKLSEEYECNRHTIRKVIEALVEKGYLIKEHKGRTYVNKEPSKYSLSLGSLYDMFTPQEIKTKVINFEKIVASVEISEKLGLDDGEEVWFIKRLREIKDVPHHVEYIYMPYRMFDDLSNTRCNSSILNYIEEKENCIISHGIKNISAITLTEEYSKLLKRQVGELALQIENTGFLTSGRIYEYSINIHRENNISYYAKK